MGCMGVSRPQLGPVLLCIISLYFLGCAYVCEGRVGGLEREDEAANRASGSSLGTVLSVELFTDRLERVLKSAVGKARPKKGGFKATLRPNATTSSKVATPHSPSPASTSGLSVNSSSSSSTPKADATAPPRQNFGSILGLIFACVGLMFALMLLAATCLCGSSRGSIPPTIQLDNMEMGKPAKGGLQMGEFDDSFSDITLTPRTPAQAHTRGNGGSSAGLLHHIPGFGRKVAPLGFLNMEGGGNFMSTRRLVSELANPVHMYTHKELHKATRGFTTQVGEGSFGPVYKAIFANGMEAAVKVLSKSSPQGEREFQAEVSLLGRLQHCQLVNLLGFCSNKGHRMLVYEFMPNGSLDERLHDGMRIALKWVDRVRLVKEIACGIEYLHEKAMPPVIHRDIKSANVLLDLHMSARVADFGLSRAKTDPEQPKENGAKGTAGYVDPDYLSSNIYTEKNDVYSFGVLLFEIVAGRSPQRGLIDYINLATMGEDGKERERWAVLIDPRLDGRYSREELAAICSIGLKCLKKGPRRRPKMSEVVEALDLIGVDEGVSLGTPPLGRPLAAARTPGRELGGDKEGTEQVGGPTRREGRLPSFKKFQRLDAGEGGPYGRNSTLSRMSTSESVERGTGHH